MGPDERNTEDTNNKYVIAKMNLIKQEPIDESEWIPPEQYKREGEFSLPGGLSQDAEDNENTEENGAGRVSSYY